MGKLRAFVGHSFTKEDEAVVSAFLNYFDTIKSFGMGFDWDHAHVAAPEDLREKVLRIAKDKNLFIGICTAKENAIGAHKFYRLPIINWLTLNKSALEVKTSDWVIQEIGFAIGRNMKLILLVEEGVRRPGGLQGNIEYISFSRESPEKSFPRILEMINSALKSEGTSAEGLQASEPETSETAPKPPSTSADENLFGDPDSSWARDTFISAYFEALANRDTIQQRKIDAAFLTSEHAKLVGAVQTWESEKARWEILTGDPSALRKIQAIAADQPTSFPVLIHLGGAYEVLLDDPNAAKAYLKAHKCAKTDEEKLRSIKLAIGPLIKLKEMGAAQKLIAESKAICSADGALSQTGFEILKLYAEKMDNADLYIGVCEQLISRSPDDTTLRFDLAYKHSEAYSAEQSLYHYLRIPHRSRSAGTWNNLGVAYGNLKMPINSVSAYRRAESDVHTLAMSNLASTYLKAGLEPEARQTCASAMAVKDYDKRVPTVIVEIDDAVAKEEKRVEEIEKKAEQVHRFLADFGNHQAMADIELADGEWQSPKCKLHFRIQNGKLSARGTYNTPNSTVGALFQLSMGSKQPDTLMHVELDGEVFGHAAICHMRVYEDGKRDSGVGLLGIAPTEKLLLAIASDLKTVKVYSPSSSKDNYLYSFDLPKG